MKPPQDLNTIIADLNPAYSQTEKLLGNQRSGLGIKYDSQRSALGAEKVQGFNQINNQATGKGMSFSGIPVDEQATYLSTKYLPGLQNIASQQNQEDMQLQMTLAEMAKEKRLKATDIRGQQQSAYEQYLEAERNRAFQAEQNRLEREASAAQAAANRAAASAGSSGPGANTMKSIADTLNSKKGKDQFVSPETYRAQAQAWMAAGGSPAAFNDAFGSYVNMQHQRSFGGYY